MENKKKTENAKKRESVINKKMRTTSMKARKTVRREESQKKKKRAKTVLPILFTALVLLVLYFVFALYPTLDTTSNPFDSRPAFLQNFKAASTSPFWTNFSLSDYFASSEKPEDVEGVVRNEHSYNIMVVGKDRTGLNTDVMMVVNFNSATQKINVLQVPRDTYVEDTVNRYGNKRINAILAHWLSIHRNEFDTSNQANKGGLEYLEKTIESTFGITIDKYCMIDLDGFVDIIDAIGGVPMNVPSNMKYSDPEQNLYINIKKGEQVLSGKDAEGFVRFRSGYTMGDLGRVDAQKLFLSALMEKLTSSDWYTLDKLTDVAGLVIKNCTTNLTLKDIIGYLRLIDFGTFSPDSITFYTAAGESFTGEGGASLYSLYLDENLEIINRAFNVYNTDITKNKVTLVEKIKSGYFNPNTSGMTIEDVKENQPHVWGSSSSVSKPVVNDTPVKDEPTEDVPVDDIPVDDVPVDDVPVDDAPVDDTPVDDVPVDDVPVDDVPVDDVPVDDVPVDDVPVDDVPVDDTPADDASVPDEYIEENVIPE